MSETLKNLAKTAELLYSKSMKTYTIQDLVIHRGIPYKNLFEILGQYPSYGRGFKVYRKTWPEHKYIIVQKAQFKDQRHGKVYGYEYEFGKLQNEFASRIRNCNKRGIWRYEVQNCDTVTDNGLKYSTEIQKDYKP